MAGMRPAPERPRQLGVLADKQHHFQLARHCSSVFDRTPCAGHITARARDDRPDSGLLREHFRLRELRDQDLKSRNHGRVFVLPRQVAIYIARKVTGASLQEIGRQFGMHHTTVLHSINKIEAMRRTDEALDRTITGLINTGSCVIGK